MLLSVENMCLDFGIRRLLDQVNFYLNEGDKTGLIGINGTGKSSFLRVLAGVTEMDSGTYFCHPGAKISYLPQNPSIEDQATVLQQVFMNLPDEMKSIHDYEAKSMLNHLGISDFQQKMGTLSGGQRKRVALAAALLQPSDILILDEPTNHLDAEMTQWLEQYLSKYKGGIIMVTHDRYFLQRVVNHITELSHGKLYHYEANYAKYLELKQQRQEMAEASERKRQSILREEREWIMRGCKARTTKSKDRIERYEVLMNQDTPEYDDSVQISAASSSRLGKKTVQLEHVCKSFENRAVIQDFSYRLLRTDRIGIIGKNGAGKSTLLNLMAGLLSPDSGTVEIGSTVKIGYFTQEGRELNLNQRVYDFIHDISDQVRTEEGTFTAKQMMERFLFPSELQSVSIGKLSGGERRRLYLLSILMEAPNLLILDEPTNDLDIMTLSILEDYLQSFPGPVLVVSHDRFFLDKMADFIWEVQGDGRIVQYTGNWTDWSKKQAGSVQPQKQEKKESERTRSQRLRFSYKEQKEFDSIETDIADLEHQISDIEVQQSLCGSDYIKLQELQKLQSEFQSQLDYKTERWLYLTDLKEQIDAQKSQ